MTHIVGGENAANSKDLSMKNPGAGLNANDLATNPY